MRIRVFFADPVGSRIRIDLNDDLQTNLFSQSRQNIDRIEIKLSLLRLGRRPIHPAADGIESQPPDLFEISSPDLALSFRIRDQHWSPGLPTAIPDSHGKEVGRFLFWCRWLLRQSFRQEQPDGQKRQPQETHKSPRSHSEPMRCPSLFSVPRIDSKEVSLAQIFSNGKKISGGDHGPVKVPGPPLRSGY